MGPFAEGRNNLFTNPTLSAIGAHRARQNGLTEAELKEVIIHLAFYAGWPK